jgi:hypothetical protein
MNQDTAGTVTRTLPFYPMVIGGQRMPAATKAIWVELTARLIRNAVRPHLSSAGRFE